METKDFEIKVLTELASIKEMIKDYGRVKDDASVALTLSRQNKEDIKDLKDRIEKIESKLDNQEQKKGMKWDKLIDYLFYVILAYCLWKIGLKP